jgi:hypothetical protein
MHAKKLAVAAVSTGALSLAGWVGPATAAHAAACDKYPPVHCSASFSADSYHRGDQAAFTSDKAFFRHELVDGKMKCRRHHYHHNVGTFRAHHHRVKGEFTVPNNAPRGHCHLILTGESSGNVASGSFDVVTG